VLSVGNLVPAKGFDLLIDAFRALLESSTDKTMTLYVAGDGPQRAALEASAARASLGGRVRFVGAVQHERLVWWYNAADVFCLASSREGHPNVVMEALACGTPVVATRVGGIPEVLRTDRVGLLSEREPRELAAALARALTRSWDRPFIEQYAGEYSWERSARSVAAVFRTVIEARRGRHPSVEAGAGARLRIGDRG
jgi:teichuronic acid biosynthesis glycosyltransferase TuaC